MALALSACAPANAEETYSIAYSATTFVWHDNEDTTESSGLVSVGPAAGGKGYLSLAVPEADRIVGVDVYILSRPGNDAGAYVKARDIRLGPDAEEPEIVVHAYYESLPNSYTVMEMRFDHAVDNDLAYSLEVWCTETCTLGGARLIYVTE